MRSSGAEQGRLVAMDINKKRLGALKTAAAAQGLQDLMATRTGDLCQYADWVASQQEEEQREHQYDRVLVDAPCSGLGVLAKRYHQQNHLPHFWQHGGEMQCLVHLPM